MALPEIVKDIEARIIRPTSTDNAIVRFDGTTGQVQNTANTIDDSNNAIFQRVINSGTICITGRNFNNEVSTSTCGGTVFGIEYDDVDNLPENGIVQIRGSSGSFGLASHCSYTDQTGESVIGERCFYKNAENNYCKNNGYSLTPTALILKDDGHLKYYIGNTKVYSKNEKIIMNEYEILHTGNINLVDNRYVLKSGDTMTGQLKFTGSNGIQTRHIDGESTTFAGDLFLNYGVNAPIHVGNGGAHTISADGSTYSGKAAQANVLAVNSSLVYGAHNMQYFNASLPASGAVNSNYAPTADWWHIIRMNHGDSGGYWVDIGACFHQRYLAMRRVANGTDYGWSRIWTQGDSVTGAIWNDYAECREADIVEPGYVLIEKGDDTLTKSTERLQPFAGVSSDTWGFSQGETEKAKTPIAVAGRVLVYTYRDRNEYKPGDCVCAAPGGTIDIMTREEIINYPDRIVGTVSNVPNYETWGGGEGADRDPVSVNGRIWIKVK